ncbi:MAG: TlpA family protein disulfide reductase [Sphingobacteriales bacterium]
MRYLYLFVFALIISSCNRAKYVEFDGSITGISNGAFAIKDPQGNQILSVLISDGKFHTKNFLPKAGFYDMFITPDLEKDYKKKLFEVYLNGDNYTITADKEKLFLYPTIKSDSKIQNELSDYYTAATTDEHAIKIQDDSISDMLYGKNTPLVIGSDEYFALQKQFKAVTASLSTVQAKSLADYVSKNPENDIEAFLMAQVDYKKEPEAYNAIYQKFTTEQKNTDDGKAEGDDLNQLMKLTAGSPAPKISGKTLDGKPFDKSAVNNKKVILVEFWQANSDVCKLNHVKLLNAYSDLLINKNFTIISVSMDTKRDEWVNAIQQQKLPWIQVSELLGQTSPNMLDWAVSTIPTYDLVDGNWHIIKRDVDFGDLYDEINKDLKK